MNCIKHIFTGLDGETYDISRVLWMIGVVAFLCFTGYDVWKNQKFDMASYGLAYSGLLAAGAVGVKIKESQEPKEKV